MSPVDCLFNIAHMCNSSEAVQYAVECGSNGVEIDIAISDDGVLLAHHPGLSDCSVLPYGICNYQSSDRSLEAVCAKVGYYSERIQLVYFDIKQEALSQARRLGSHIRTLFELGYAGQIIVAVSFFGVESSSFLRKLNKWLSLHCPSRCESIFYTFDDGVGRHQTLDIYEILRSLVGNQIVMSFGNSALSMVNFQEELTVARRLHISGLIAGVFTFTLDRRASMKNAMNTGVTGILTNRPRVLAQMLRGQPKVKETRVPALIRPSGDQSGFLIDRASLLAGTDDNELEVVDWFGQVGVCIRWFVLLSLSLGLFRALMSLNYVGNE
jgi:glycerophosphoryl diester phosphodiesterase